MLYVGVEKLIADLIKSGMTQQDIANKLTLSESSISRFKNGTRDNISYHTYFKLFELHQSIFEKNMAGADLEKVYVSQVRKNGTRIVRCAKRFEYDG